jgi:hypothetical protein
VMSQLSKKKMTYCLHHRPNDGGSKHLWNVGLLQRDYTALYPRRLSSSYSPPWEPEISHSFQDASRPKVYTFKLFQHPAHHNSLHLTKHIFQFQT